MLKSHAFEDHGREGQFFTRLRETEDLPAVIQFWMAHVARDVLRLGVFFRAAALIYRIPGGAHYRCIAHDDVDDNLPDDDEDPRHWIGRADFDTAFSVLAECLKRLDAADVMKQVPGGEDYEQVELSAEWNEYLDRRAENEHGLLNVIAECLDELVVRPEMAEIDVEPQSTWWQRWWSRME